MAKLGFGLVGSVGKGMLGAVEKEVAEEVAEIAGKSAADRLRLSTQLAFEEAGILTQGGSGLSKNAIASAREIPISGGRLTNPSVVEELTKNGSRIEDWAKMTTQSVMLRNGQNSQIHFYT